MEAKSILEKVDIRHFMWIILKVSIANTQGSLQNVKKEEQKSKINLEKFKTGGWNLQYQEW